MAKVLVTEGYLSDIADAIREKKSSQDTYTPAEMADAIESIQTGITPSGTKSVTITSNGTTTEDVTNYANAEITVNIPSGSPTLVTKTITENGTYSASSDNADGYSSVTVNVPSGGGGISIDDIVTCAAPTGDVVLNSATFIKPYGFYKTEITSIKANEALEVGEYAFAEADTLTKVCLPKATTLGNRAFTKLKPMILVAPSVTSMATYLFQFPVTSQGTFVLDFGESLTSIQASVFIQTDNANDVIMILRNKNAVVTAGNMDAMPKAFWNGNRTAKLYVPSSLLSSYQTASNWATAYAHTGTQFIAIEGSIYENQYADGTPISS